MNKSDIAFSFIILAVAVLLILTIAWSSNSYKDTNRELYQDCLKVIKEPKYCFERYR